MSSALSTPPTASKFVASTFDHPRLTAADASSIRVFLRAYDQYATEIQERARQLIAQDAVATEAINLVNFKFCIDAEWLKSTILLGFIDGLTSVDLLTETRLES